MNDERAEGLLREYLLHHRPKPFINIVGVGTDSRKKGCLVFREPGTRHDLVISIKFVPEFPHGYHTTDAGSRWEHAMFSGMSWRQKMNQEKLQQQHQDNGLARIAAPNQESYLSPTKKNVLPPSLIISAIFTNIFGLELVGHVDESPMEDVQFRFQAKSSLPLSTLLSPAMPLALEYSTILGEVEIYRWKNCDNESSCNLIGFIPPTTGSSIADVAQARLSLRSLSKIVKQNSTYRPNRPILGLPLVYPLHYLPVKLSKEMRFFLRSALPSPSLLPWKDLVKSKTITTVTASPKSNSHPFRRGLRQSYSQSLVNQSNPSLRNRFREHSHSPGCNTHWNPVVRLLPRLDDTMPIQAFSSRQRVVSDKKNKSIPSVSHHSSGDSVPSPQQDALICYNGVMDKNNIAKVLFDGNGPCIGDKRQSRPKNPKTKQRLLTYAAAATNSINNPVKKTSMRSEGNKGKRKVTFEETEGARNNLDIVNFDCYAESRNDWSTSRSKMVSAPSSGDIAINLLCPYHHPPDQTFVVSNETPHQRGFRHKIEGSSWCKHLKGRFLVEFQPFSHNHGQWIVRKISG